MSETSQKLTEEQKNRVWSTIDKNQCSDDRDPKEVIREDYNGNEDAYLIDMAEWHNILI